MEACTKAEDVCPCPDSSVVRTLVDVVDCDAENHGWKLDRDNYSFWTDFDDFDWQDYLRRLPANYWTSSGEQEAEDEADGGAASARVPRDERLL